VSGHNRLENGLEEVRVVLRAEPPPLGHVGRAPGERHPLLEQLARHARSHARHQLDALQHLVRALLADELGDRRQLLCKT